MFFILRILTHLHFLNNSPHCLTSGSKEGISSSCINCITRLTFPNGIVFSLYFYLSAFRTFISLNFSNICCCCKHSDSSSVSYTLHSNRLISLLILKEVFILFSSSSLESCPCPFCIEHTCSSVVVIVNRVSQDSSSSRIGSTIQ